MHLKLEHELTILFLATATIYGAIHCTAWWFVFPSTTERWLWRSSALAVSILPSLFGLQWFLVVKFSARSYSPSPSRLVDRLEHIFHITSTSRLLVMLAVYVIARIALLVLPLLSLRSLSPDAYIGINWTNVVPHL
ncbi:hypothetical protein CPB84DRAFT_1846832 [Gymnopilus junonius]|uniref:Transmembrane protein n=1 Tax=Gymnopilus junonius TaxID=109634 RepID=A0A9P5TP68_GYMJU|nr:hypothetical protein CPB84DRAFT_1846832 [Gymnopilus junonius]